jgi:hypothetical protein
MGDRQEPPDDTAIWRYMDLPRFVLLMSERKSHFTKLAVLRAGDPHEGLGRAQGLPELPKDDKAKTADMGAGEVLYYLSSHHAAKSVENASNLLFVNSWCLGSESLGMWMLYGAAGTGIAVRSTIGQFKAALKRELRSEQYCFGKVHYYDKREDVPELNHDFTAGTIPASGNLWKLLLKIALHKREAYLHEREWRAVIYQDPRDIPGIDIPVDLDALISGVFVGPRAGAVEIEATNAVMTQAGFSQKLTKSDLLDPVI